MKAAKTLALIGTLALGFTLAGTGEVEAGHYTGWRPQGGYYYSSYYYTPVRYHYAIYYPKYPQYVYYYNPYKKVYWGRFDLQGKPGEEYSLLAEKDRKQKLTDIPDEAFPKPGAMPAVPDADNSEAMERPPAPPKVDSAS